MPLRLRGKNAELKITNSDPDSPAMTVGLSGTGVEADLGSPKDATAPTIDHFRVKRLPRLRRPARKIAVTFKFNLSEDADITIKIFRKRKGKWRKVESLSEKGLDGANTLKFRLKGLKRGRYLARIKAVDSSDNASQTSATRFSFFPFDPTF